MVDKQNNQDTTEPSTSPKGYGKRPLWQWILVYLVVGAVVYFLIYILFFNGDGTGSNGSLY